MVQRWFLQTTPGKAQCVSLLLQAGSPVGERDSSQRTELHLACSQGAVQIVEMLLDYGADINAVNEVGNTPLHICTSKGYTNCAAVLLRRGACPVLSVAARSIDAHSPDRGCACATVPCAAGCDRTIQNLSGDTAQQVRHPGKRAPRGGPPSWC